MFKTLKNWWPSLVAVITTASIYVGPALQNYVTKNPGKSIAAGIAWAVASHFSPSPLQSRTITTTTTAAGPDLQKQV